MSAMTSVLCVADEVHDEVEPGIGQYKAGAPFRFVIDGYDVDAAPEDFHTAIHTFLFGVDGGCIMDFRVLQGRDG
jgi:hypothetical protein